MTRRWTLPGSIRFRLGAALAAALLPVLVLGLFQSKLAFDKDAHIREDALLAAAERSAATARARIEATAVLLSSMGPEEVGLNCGPHLAELTRRLPGYLNLIRYSSGGRIACSAHGASIDPAGAEGGWFERLAAGDDLVIRRALPGEAEEPALFAAMPATTRNGRFDGAMAAVIALSSLRLTVDDRTLPAGAAIAIADSRGRILTSTRPGDFDNLDPSWSAVAGTRGSLMRGGRNVAGERRIFAVSALVSDDLFVLLSAPEQGVISWAKLNAISGGLLPLLAFLIALISAWVITERVVIRWLHYLQRVASIYARGRFTVRSARGVEGAPPEIRELAQTLDAMAETIVARDQSLLESLAHKDGLMREIHHRVKNNLQVISSLVSMQQRALTDPAARTAMVDTRLRIGALALVYRALYQGPDLRRIDLRAFLQELIAQLIVSEHPHGHAVRTALDVDELTIDPDKLAPLALFAVEAITNAQKHAFAGQGGVLTVDLAVADGEARLAIADKPANPGAEPAGVGEGVGRTLMTAFARQLRGQASFSANAQGGLTAELTFPVDPRPEPPPVAAPAKLKRNRARS